MRFRHPDGTTIHLAYCTNVHGAEDLDGVIAQLSRFARPIRDRLGVGRLGLGLWAARRVQLELTGDPKARHRLRAELDRQGLEVVTMNAFPYSGFHASTVKKSVYRPDWTDPDRLDYTLGCARLLAELLPPDAARGSVSTLPVGWREPWSADRARIARRHLDALAAGLTDLAERTGRVVRVGLEPEPGCLVERTETAVEWLDGLSTVGVCLDACHLAVAFEDPAVACDRLAAAGVPLVKAQASCAVQADDPADPAQLAALRRLDEPRYLHQVRAIGRARPGVPANGMTIGVDDLREALDDPPPGAVPWRIHHHVPLHADPPGALTATRPELLATLTALLGGPSARTDHVEVETYTWPVLAGPPGDRLDDRGGDRDLIEGIAAELAWTRDAMTSLGVEDENR